MPRRTLLPFAVCAVFAAAACVPGRTQRASRALSVDQPSDCRFRKGDVPGSLACRFDVTPTSDRRLLIGTIDRVATDAERRGHAARSAACWVDATTAAFRRRARRVGPLSSERYVPVPAAERGATACVQAELACALALSSPAGARSTARTCT